MLISRAPILRSSGITSLLGGVVAIVLASAQSQPVDAQPVVNLTAGTLVANEGTGCSAARLRGPYVFTANAFRSFQGPQLTYSAFSPVAVLGKYVFDGAGTVSRSVTVSFAGLPSFPVTDSGVYVVNADCSGSVNFPANSEMLNFNIVNSHSVVISTTTPGEVGAGTLEKQLIQHCDLASLRGHYIFTIIGTTAGTFENPVQNPPLLTDAFFPGAVIGSWNVDGVGAISRSMSVNFGGFAFPYADVGSYQVNADCSASAFFPNDQETFDMIFIDSNRVAYQVGPTGRVAVGPLVKQNLEE